MKKRATTSCAPGISRESYNALALTTPLCRADQLLSGGDSVSREALNGGTATRCWNCAAQLPAEPKRCVRCTTGVYCNNKCQNRDYEMHKAHCSEHGFLFPMPRIPHPPPPLPPDQ